MLLMYSSDASKKSTAQENLSGALECKPDYVSKEEEETPITDLPGSLVINLDTYPRCNL